jgi:hypothetical protein
MTAKLGTPHQEYVAALAAYSAAKERLIEAKRHFDPATAPEAVAKRRAKQAEYRAKRKAAWKRERDAEEHAARMSVWMEDYNRRNGVHGA